MKRIYTLNVQKQNTVYLRLSLDVQTGGAGESMYCIFYDFVGSIYNGIKSFKKVLLTLENNELLKEPICFQWQRHRIDTDRCRLELLPATAKHQEVLDFRLQHALRVSAEYHTHILPIAGTVVVH